MTQNRKYNIALDFDDVSIEFIRPWCQVYNEMFGERKRRILRPEGITQWDLMYLGDLTHYELQLTFHQLRFQYRYTEKSKPVDPKMAYVIKALRARGHNCFVLTSNPPEMVPLIEDYFRKQGIEIDVVNVNSLEEKFEHDFDFILDDAPAVIQYDTDRVIVGMVRNHNLDYIEEADHYVYDWMSFYHIVKIYEAEKVPPKRVIYRQ